MKRLLQGISQLFQTARLGSLLLVTVFLFAEPVTAESSVWEVTSDTGGTVYLGGTVHLLRPQDFPLPPEFDEAYEHSQELVFETDISAMGDLATQAQMLQELTYSDDRTLETVLSEEAYQALEAYTREAGMPLMMMQKFKPGMVISTLQVLEFQSLGFTPQGVDAHFNTRAVGDAKSLGALESIAEQISFLAEMGEGNESEFILLSLEDLESTGEVMEEMLVAWREGDTQTLAELFVNEMRSEAPELYESLLRRRNLNWLPQIETMLEDSDIEFVLVGAAHLVGDEGLLSLLEERGYRIRQL